MDKYTAILQQYWGHTSFRDLQDKIILSIAEGRDTLGLMPTGGGKSITFQVPALAMEGVCIVITPLIALMKDQVENLRNRGIKAVAVFSGMTKDEIHIALDNCILGGYKFLYISPERLATEIFKTKLRQMQVSFLVVDESHCISQWGYDFRPSYLRIADIRELLPDIPVLALTATATPQVVIDIQEKLQFRRKNVFQKSFERKNLSYVVREVEDKLHFLLKTLHSVPGSAIVYVRDRKKTKEISDFLLKNSITSDFFHAGLTNSKKDKKQENWKKGNCRVIVATNAFGMGIDKPDVRLVVHIDLPDSLEAYFQEAGRAGRDEQKAYAVLLYSKADNTKLKKRISNNFPEKEKIIRVYEALGNYFQLAVGHGLGMIYNFNLAEFCSSFRFGMLPAFSSLKILQQAGYIELTDEQDNPSRLMFMVHRDELYRLKLENPLFDNLLSLILRLYTGTFADYTRINEDELAYRLKITRQHVYESLVTLSKLRIIKYIPAKKTPLIIFTQERQETNHIRITTEVYEDRKIRFEERINAMLDYARNKDICRSKILLNYFGEKNFKQCRTCDVCMQQKKKKVNTDMFSVILSAINEKLNAEPLTVEQLVDSLRFNEDDTIKVIRFLIDNNVIHHNETMQLELTDKNL